MHPHHTSYTSCGVSACHGELRPFFDFSHMRTTTGERQFFGREVLHCVIRPCCPDYQVMRSDKKGVSSMARKIKTKPVEEKHVAGGVMGAVGGVVGGTAGLVGGVAHMGVGAVTGTMGAVGGAVGLGGAKKPGR